MEFNGIKSTQITDKNWANGVIHTLNRTYDAGHEVPDVKKECQSLIAMLEFVRDQVESFGFDESPKLIEATKEQLFDELMRYVRSN